MGKRMGNFSESFVSFESVDNGSVDSEMDTGPVFQVACKAQSESLGMSKLQRLALSCAAASATLLSVLPTALAQNVTQLSPSDSAANPSAAPAAVPSAIADDLEVTLFDTLARQSFSEDLPGDLSGNLFESQQAQADSSEPDGPLQSEVTLGDQQVMEELISIAVRNAPAVRDARAAMGIAPFVDAFLFEISPSRLSSTLSDASDPVLAIPYSYSDTSTTTTFTFNPIQLINGIQQMPALQSHLRDAEQQTRLAVIQNYVAYVQAQQASSVATRQLNTVVAAALEQSQVASSQLDQIPASSVLANNEDYIAAATESLAANSDEMVALETLAAVVGMPSQEMLTMIETTVTQAAKGQPAVTVEQLPEAQPSPATLVIHRDRG
jgi:hypothetical protein